MWHGGAPCCQTHRPRGLHDSFCVVVFLHGRLITGAAVLAGLGGRSHGGGYTGGSATPHPRPLSQDTRGRRGSRDPGAGAGASASPGPRGIDLTSFHVPPGWQLALVPAGTTGGGVGSVVPGGTAGPVVPLLGIGGGIGGGFGTVGGGAGGGGGGSSPSLQQQLQQLQLLQLQQQLMWAQQHQHQHQQQRLQHQQGTMQPPWGGLPLWQATGSPAASTGHYPFSPLAVPSLPLGGPGMSLLQYGGGVGGVAGFGSWGVGQAGHGDSGWGAASEATDAEDAGPGSEAAAHGAGGRGGRGPGHSRRGGRAAGAGRGARGRQHPT